MKDVMKQATMSLIILDVFLAALKDAKNALPQPNVLHAKKAVVTTWIKKLKPAS